MMEQTIEHAWAALQPWQSTTDRALASDGVVVADNTPPPVLDEDRESWMDWAMSQMHTTQKYLDAIPDDPTHRIARRELTLMINHLVSFYGYAEAGNFKKMTQTLTKVRTSTENASQAACSKKSL